MKAIKTSNPFIHLGRTPKSAMISMIVCLSFLAVFSTFTQGIRVLYLAVLSILFCVIAEWAVALITHLPSPVGDLSAVVTGLIIIMLIPVTLPVWILLIADLFAIVLAKGFFGGLGHNPFNPAACAIAFLSVSWPDKMFSFPLAFQHIGIRFAADTLKIAPSPAYFLKSYGIPPYPHSDAILGSVPSAIGTSCFLIILASFVLLALKDIIRWRVTVSFLLVVAILSAAINRTGNVWESVFWELFSGYIMFGAVFMVTDPSTSAKSRAGSYIYGAICAVITVIMRVFGTYETGFCFALILSNAVSPLIDKIIARINNRRVYYAQNS